MRTLSPSSIVRIVKVFTKTIHFFPHHVLFPPDLPSLHKPSQWRRIPPHLNIWWTHLLQSGWSSHTQPNFLPSCGDFRRCRRRRRPGYPLHVWFKCNLCTQTVQTLLGLCVLYGRSVTKSALASRRLCIDVIIQFWSQPNPPRSTTSVDSGCLKYTKFHSQEAPSGPS